MLRYVMSALALKAFSVNRLTKRAYRVIGNVVGERIRKSGTYVETYIQRGDLFRELSEKHNITPDGGRLLEIGTGWLHWHSIYHRLFNNVEIAMLDIWDCRQFGALKPVFLEVKEKGAENFQDNQMARQNLDTILSAESFDDLYRELGLSYHVEETGTLHGFGDESLDCVFSFHVLEHVPRKNVDILVSDIYRVLRPGGFSVHQIGIDDHLQHYDPRMSKKNYIRYSDRVWKLLFENELQYFNKIQMSEWLQAFGGERFVQLEAISEHCSIDGLPVNGRFTGYSNDDLSCTTLTIIHRKNDLG